MIASKFALLDVTRGRKKLARLLDRSPQRIPVTVRGFIVGTWGNDDGISQEFEMAVTDVQEETP